MAFWKKIFKSKYTGAEIDAAIAKTGDLTKVTANPTLAGTEAALEGLQVGDTKYKVGGGDIGVINVITDIPNTAIRTELTVDEVVALMTAGPCLVHWIYGSNVCTYLPLYADTSGMAIFGFDLMDPSQPPTVYQFTPLTIDDITYYGLNT